MQRSLTKECRASIEGEEKGRKNRTIFSTTINCFDNGYSSRLKSEMLVLSAKIFRINWNRPLAIKILAIRPPRWVGDVTPYARPGMGDATASKTSENLSKRRLKEADAVFTSKLSFSQRNCFIFTPTIVTKQVLLSIQLFTLNNLKVWTDSLTNFDKSHHITRTIKDILYVQGKYNLLNEFDFTEIILVHLLPCNLRCFLIFL